MDQGQQKSGQYASIRDKTIKKVEKSTISFKEYNLNRNKTMKNKKIKMDLNIENYDVEELAAILNLRDLKITKSKIKEKIQYFKKKHTQPDYINFFTKAEEKILNYFDQENKQTWVGVYDRTAMNSDAEKVFKTRYIKNEKKDQNLLLDEKHNVIGKEKISLENTLQSKENVQGDKNPINRSILKKIINFDSHYREILRPYSYACFETSNNTSLITNSEKRLYRSSNYTVSLSKPLSNIVDLTLNTVEIPNSWYVFSKDYGTSAFKIYWWDKSYAEDQPPDANELLIKIDDGNYTQQQLIDAINQKIQENQITNPNDETKKHPKVNFEYFSYNNKVQVTSSEEENNVSIFWYVIDTNVDNASYGGGSRIDYNLGWLLGWRVSSTLLINTSQSTNNNNKSTCDAQVDIYGPKYFLITLDDFNNNKPNQDLISLEEGGSVSFKLPSYYNTQTMDRRYAIGNDRLPKYYPGYSAEDGDGYKCQDIADINNNKRGCSNTDLNNDLLSNLTQAQVYTYEQLQLANSSKGVIRYVAPSPSDLLARVPINRNPQDWESNIFFKNDTPEYNKRIYFGPVKIRKFNVRLLTDKGFEVNLNGKDWSFSVILSQLYQF